MVAIGFGMGYYGVTGMGPGPEKEFVMSGIEKRYAALEQAAVALLAEARAAGVNLSEVSEKAKLGLIANAQYTWISNHELKAESAAAVDYLVKAVKPGY